MKILKEGKIPEKTIKWYKVECGNCGTFVTFNEFDKDVAITKVKTIKMKTLGGENGYNFKCPLCEKQVEGMLKYAQYAHLPIGQEPNENTQWTWLYAETIGTVGTGTGVLDFSKPISTEPIKFPTTIVGTYDCETCPVNPWKKNNGKITLGDTPCNWCPKMMPAILSSNDK